MLTPREKPERHDSAGAGGGAGRWEVSEREDCGVSPGRGGAASRRLRWLSSAAQGGSGKSGWRKTDCFPKMVPGELRRRYFGAQTQANYVATRCARESSACCGVNLAGSTGRGGFYGGVVPFCLGVPFEERRFAGRGLDIPLCGERNGSRKPGGRPGCGVDVPHFSGLVPGSFRGT